MRVGASKTELTKQPEKARALWTRGFDKQYYLDLILASLREHGPVGRSEVNDALVSKLPDRLGPEQKRRKVHNLLQELRRSGQIVNEGTRSRPRWNLGTASHKLADRKPPKGRT